jgi:hypothetical protein
MMTGLRSKDDGISLTLSELGLLQCVSKNDPMTMGTRFSKAIFCCKPGTQKRNWKIGKWECK